MAIAILQAGGGPEPCWPHTSVACSVQCGLRAKILTRGYLRDCPLPCHLRELQPRVACCNKSGTWNGVLPTAGVPGGPSPCPWWRVLLGFSGCPGASATLAIGCKIDHSSSVGEANVHPNLLQNEQRFQGAPSALRNILNLLPNEGDVDHKQAVGGGDPQWVVDMLRLRAHTPTPPRP